MPNHKKHELNNGDIVCTSGNMLYVVIIESTGVNKLLPIDTKVNIEMLNQHRKQLHFMSQILYLSDYDENLKYHGKCENEQKYYDIENTYSYVNNTKNVFTIKYECKECVHLKVCKYIHSTRTNKCNNFSME